MSAKCGQLHALLNGLKRHSYPFNENGIPPNGIYIQFERGEVGHGGDRIVRIGTHTGAKSFLKDRLNEHWFAKNEQSGEYKGQYRSIFRDKIGDAIINKSRQEGSGFWTKEDLILWADPWRGGPRKWEKFQMIERIEQYRKTCKLISDYVYENISFALIEMETLEQRKYFEKRLISTVSNCTECRPSKDWLGNFSTKLKVCQSGLWQEEQLWKDDLTDADMDFLTRAATGKLR